MSSLRRISAALALVVVASLSARAADPAPVRIAHQGRILNGDNVPLTGAHTLKFTIYRYLAPPTAGTGLTDEKFWTDTYDVTLTDGVYAVVLGEGGKEGNALSASAFADERFLAINLDGVDLTPRLRIGTAPFAANAVTAQNILRNGQPLFDEQGRFKGPTDNLDVPKLGGKSATDFALANHQHDDVYLKSTDAASTYATKAELANVGSTLSTTYYTKDAADERFAQKGDLAPYAKTGDLTSTYLTKQDAADTYAPKTGAMPKGAMVLSESAADAGLLGAGMKLYGSLASGWATKPNAPFATSHMDRGVEVNGKLYFVGGHIGGTGRGCSNNYGNINRTQIFDIATNTWSSGADMPTPRHSHATLAANGKIYAIAGYGCGVYTAVNEIYNIASNTWSSGAGVPNQHAHHWGAFEEVGGKFYLIGGCANSGDCKTPQTHVYDPANDTWSSRSPAPRPVYATAHAVINGKIYVAAGYDHNVSGGMVRTGYEYDPVGDSWKPIAEYPGTLSYHIAAVAIAGKMHFFGGHGGGGDPHQSHHWVYDPATNGWSKAEPVGWGAYGMTAVALGTRAFVLGGWGGSAFSNFAEYNAGLFIYRKD